LRVGSTPTWQPDTATPLAVGPPHNKATDKTQRRHATTHEKATCNPVRSKGKVTLLRHTMGGVVGGGGRVSCLHFLQGCSHTRTPPHKPSPRSANREHHTCIVQRGTCAPGCHGGGDKPCARHHPKKKERYGAPYQGQAPLTSSASKGDGVTLPMRRVPFSIVFLQAESLQEARPVTASST
jgi:hypothetical protein